MRLGMHMGAASSPVWRCTVVLYRRKFEDVRGMIPLEVYILMHDPVSKSIANWFLCAAVLCVLPSGLEYSRQAVLSSFFICGIALIHPCLGCYNRLLTYLTPTWLGKSAICVCPGAPETKNCPCLSFGVPDSSHLSLPPLLMEKENVWLSI